MPLTKLTDTEPGETELQALRKRLDDQDKRVRELEAGETVLSKRIQEQDETISELRVTEANFGKAFATVRHVDECMADIKNEVEKNEHFFSGELVRLKTTLQQYTDEARSALEATTDTLMGSMDDVESRLGDELSSAERRWGKDLENVDRQFDERHEELEAKLRERSRGFTDCTEYLDRSLQESLERLELVSWKDSWARELDRRDEQRRKEWEVALQQRPTHEQLAASFTSLATSSSIVDRLAELQATTAQQHHRLETGLSTVERLFLRQLDAAARLVS
jgi:hypothetical protein